MASFDAQLARRFAKRSLPNLRFSDREEYFPIRAESFLTHTTSAPWTPDADDVGALPVDDQLRGTTLMRWDDDLSIRDMRVSGPPNDTDAPLRLATDPASDAIGNPDYAKDADNLFLNFAGYANQAAPQDGGDLDYLYVAFSELASALDHRLAWRPLAQQPNRPDFAHVQPAAPAVYCEIDWAGIHPALGNADFAGGAGLLLSPFVQVTYYYLFPAREALAEPPQPGVRPLEGQWAAISAFYRASKIGRLRDAEGRPTEIEIADDAKPEFVVLSLDPLDERPTSTVLTFDSFLLQIFPAGAQVAAYVGAGTHRFFSSPNGDAVVEPPSAWPTLDYEPGSDWEGLSIAIIAAVILSLAGLVFAVIATWVLLAIGVGLLTAVAIGLAIALIAVLAALIVCILIWLLVIALSELWDDDADTSQIPNPSDAPVSGGPSAGDPNYGDPAPAGGDQQPPGGQPGGTGPGGGAQDDPTGWWPTNEGSAEGWDVGYFDTMVISRFEEHVRQDPTLAEPAWWRYAGRWGIQVPTRADQAWDSGTRRIDNRQRSWAYWQAHALVNHLVMNAPGPSGP